MDENKVRTFLHIRRAHQAIADALDELPAFTPKYRGMAEDRRAMITRLRAELEPMRKRLHQIMLEM